MTGIGQSMLEEGDAVNWQSLFRSNEHLMLQWCHRAPGMICSFKHDPPSGLTDLLVRGGNTIVSAGALKKGVSLCHGTDGNGFALLELYRRTQDHSWLAQARFFAMWAIEQSEDLFADSGQWRYSLWT